MYHRWYIELGVFRWEASAWAAGFWGKRSHWRLPGGESKTHQRGGRHETKSKVKYSQFCDEVTYVSLKITALCKVCDKTTGLVVYNTHTSSVTHKKWKEPSKNGVLILHMLLAKICINTAIHTGCCLQKSRSSLVEVGARKVAACKLLWSGDGGLSENDGKLHHQVCMEVAHNMLRELREQVGVWGGCVVDMPTWLGSAGCSFCCTHVSPYKISYKSWNLCYAQIVP